MDGVSRTCLNCQAELGLSARFCPKCGQRAATDTPASVPAGPGTGIQPPAGPGATVAAAAAAPPEPSGPPGEAPTRADAAVPAGPPPGYPPPPQPFGQLPPRPRPFQPAPADTAPTVSAPPPFPGTPSARPAAAGYPAAGYPGQPYGPTASGPAAGIVPGFDSDQPAVLPAGPPPGPPFGPPRQPPRRHDGNRPSQSRALWILLPLLLIAGGAAVLLARPFSHPAAGRTASAASQPAAPAGSLAGTGAAGSGSPGAASPAASPVTEQQAAGHVSAMLAQSVSDRTAISTAATDVARCGSSLASDPQVFDKAASSRQALLATLSSLPGRASLPPALLSDLTQAWQASVAADQAYAKWATDEVAQGCVADDTSDPGYQAATAPDQNATRDKTAFASQWNPVAARYGLTRYQPGQL